MRSAGKQPLLVRGTRSAAMIDSYSAGLRPTRALVCGATYEFEHRLEIDGELRTRRGEFVVR